MSLNLLIIQLSVSQRYIGIDVLSLFGDLKSIQLNYEIIRDSLNAFSFGSIVNFKPASELNPDYMDGRKINYNLRKGINGGLSIGYTRQIIKHLYLQNIFKIEFNKLNLSTYSATKRDSIGDVYYYSDFKKIDTTTITVKPTTTPVKNYSLDEVVKLAGVKNIPIEKICDGYKIESLDVASQELLNKIYGALLKK